MRQASSNFGCKKPENEITHVFRCNHTMIHFIDPAPGGAKKPALSQWENPDTLKHGYCACLCKALLLYGYSIADALRKVKPRSGSFIITQKWANCSLNHHSATNTPCGQRTPNVQP